MKFLILLILSLFVVSSFDIRAKETVPPTVNLVDINKYQGTWYELARLPAWFQKDCTDSKAEYSLQENGKMKVVNSCFSTKNNEWRSVTGSARVVDTQTKAKLKVLFPNFLTWILPNSWFEGDYWILALDKDYKTVLVGDPTYKYMWILSRDFSPLQNGKLLELVSYANKLGYDTDKLIYTDGK